MTHPAIHDAATHPTTDQASAIADAQQNVLTAIKSIDLRLYHAATMHLHRAAHNLSYAAKDPPQPPAPITTEQRREAIQSIISEMIAVAAGQSPDNLDDWTSENRAIIDGWQCRLTDAILALSPPVTTDRAAVIRECARVASRYPLMGIYNVSTMRNSIANAIRALADAKEETKP